MDEHRHSVIEKLVDVLNERADGQNFTRAERIGALALGCAALAAACWLMAEVFGIDLTDLRKMVPK